VSPRTTLGAALAALVIGGGVLFVADAIVLRVGSAFVLLVAVALGAFAIATPEFVAADREDRD
jgi:hypothetical protein